MYRVILLTLRISYLEVTPVLARVIEAKKYLRYLRCYRFDVMKNPHTYTYELLDLVRIFKFV